MIKYVEGAEVQKGRRFEEFEDSFNSFSKSLNSTKYEERVRDSKREESLKWPTGRTIV